jgi:WD40 repeat protein
MLYRPLASNMRKLARYCSRTYMTAVVTPFPPRPRSFLAEPFLNPSCTAHVQGHKSYVTAVCWSPDSQTVASGGGTDPGSSGIRLWNAASGQCVGTLEVGAVCGATQPSATYHIPV